jgi:LacI family gluconate utilization system Gnt-I transcriptional repressor
LLACQRSGIKVPSELAIIGFGDYEMSEQLVPALTTVAVPTKRIGQDAARIILQRLKGDKAGPRKVDLGFDLIARESA